jgi:hypothetical protein
MRRWFRDWTPIIGVVLFVVALAWSVRRISVLPPNQPRPPDEVVDLLASAVKAECIRAAGERQLLEPLPIPVRWERSTLPLAGPVSAAVSSTQFAPLPGLIWSRS